MSENRGKTCIMTKVVVGKAENPCDRSIVLAKKVLALQ